MPTTWKCPYVFSGCLPGEDNSIGNTEAERIDVSIPEPVSACAEHLHRRVLVAMNGDDHTLEHLLCLLGITGARNGDRAHCQAEKQRNKASHSGILLYNLTKGTRDRRLAQAVDARRRAFHNHPFCESAREQRSTRLTDEGTVQSRRGVARPRRMRGFCSDPGNFWFDGSAWWARLDSNQEPDRYERSALTIELRALKGIVLARRAAGAQSHPPRTHGPQPASGFGLTASAGAWRCRSISSPCLRPTAAHRSSSRPPGGCPPRRASRPRTGCGRRPFP